MLQIREATDQDNAALCALIAQVPIAAGTAFSVDRTPDFFALLRLRGSSRTFIATSAAGEPLGLITALWHSARVAGEQRVVGELVDLRVVPHARHTRAAFMLLQAALQALQSASADWITCLVGDQNEVARQLLSGAGRKPRLLPLTRYASVHYPAWRLFRTPKSVVPVDYSGEARASWPGDAAGVPEFAPLVWPPWSEPDTRAWAAPAEAPRGAIVVSALHAVRRIRVERYAPADWPLLVGARFVDVLGLGERLPAPSGALRLWATRCLTALPPDRALVRSLVRSALVQAARAGIHVLQVNVPEHDPLLPLLPQGPRSIFWSTLYGKPTSPELAATWTPHPEDTYYADLALL